MSQDKQGTFLTTEQAERAYTLQWLMDRLKDRTHTHSYAREGLRERGQSMISTEYEKYAASLEWEMDVQADVQALNRVIAMVRQDIQDAARKAGLPGLASHTPPPVA